MKTSLVRVATYLAIGLMFASGCERATEPDVNGAGGQLTPRASEQGPSSALPDLTIDASRLQSSMFIRTQSFKASSCAVQEGCCGVGKRKLLKFEAFIPNIGDADLVLGDPGSAENAGLFEFSPCHGHYHLSGFTSYELLDATGTTVLAGRKQAFCLEDFTQTDPGAGPPLYTCGNQGIQAGWADVYGAHLDCQWIDITDIEPGEYRLRITINATPGASPKLAESDYSNNTAEVPVTIPAGKTKSKPA